jgi:AcrR family transcriptional regulator
VSLGNLYNHFARKEELIALIASLEAAELQPLLDELAQGRPGRRWPASPPATSPGR